MRALFVFNIMPEQLQVVIHICFPEAFGKQTVEFFPWVPFDVFIDPPFNLGKQGILLMLHNRKPAVEHLFAIRFYDNRYTIRCKLFQLYGI